MALKLKIQKKNSQVKSAWPHYLHV